MKLLVVGSGAREHALVWALSGSPVVSRIICAPGNAGIAQNAELREVAADDVDGLVDLARAEAIDLVVVGPELPLVLGLVDRLNEAGVRAFGPTAAAARLEGSKAFTKRFCARHGIATPAARIFGRGDRDAALAHVATLQPPVVVKADGLAAGKGVVIATCVDDAQDALRRLYGGELGEAGREVLVEEFLSGEEASLFALCDGRTALEFGTAQDHKRAFDGDRGPNTGGMGAFSPAANLDPATIERAMREIVRPALAGMADEGCPFRGILYTGLMLTVAGPRLIEFNVRLGDPEAQVLLPRLSGDLALLIKGCVDGMLGHMSLRWLPRAALGVVLATRGYPGTYPRGSEIRGLEQLRERADLLVYHGATRREGERWLADGGRVLTLTGLGDDLAQARDRAYAGIDRLDWPEGFCRRDIGLRDLHATTAPTTEW